MYAKDLERNGQQEQIVAMFKRANERIKGKDMEAFWRTEGYQGYDAVCIYASKPEFVKDQGYIVYSEVLDEPIFVKEPEDDDE